MSDKLNLMIHCGAASADREQVLRVKPPEPESTTHFPLGHGALLQRILLLCEQHDLTIVNEAHALAGPHDEDWFGMLQLQMNYSPEDCVILGTRNSNRKKFAVGLVYGAGCFVCDNLAMVGEFVMGRKHTKRMHQDLPFLAELGIAGINTYHEQHQRRQLAYRNHDLTDDEALRLITCAARPDLFPDLVPPERAFAKTRDGEKRVAPNATFLPTILIGDVYNEWCNPSYPEFRDWGRCVDRLQMAFTTTQKNRKEGQKTGLWSLPNDSENMFWLLDRVTGFNQPPEPEQVPLLVGPVEAPTEPAAALGVIDTAFVGEGEPAAEAPKRKRGRPRKAAPGVDPLNN